MGAYLRLVRFPNMIIVALFQIMLRYGLILPYFSRHGIEPALSDWLFALLVIASVCIAGGGNAINDYFDVQTDKINRPGKVVVGDVIERRDVLLVHVLLSLIGIFAGLYVSFVLRRASFMLVFLGVPILLWLYSTHFKRQMLIGNVIVALLVALTGYMVVSTEFAAIDRVAGSRTTSNEPCSTLWYVVCAYCFFAFITNLAREISKDIEDVEGDKETHCQTLPVEMGLGRSKIVFILLEVFTVITIWTAYVSSSHLQELKGFLTYIIVGLTIPTIGICVMAAMGKNAQDFHRVSTMCKFIMLVGIASILIV